MHTILITNSRTSFGKELIRSLKSRHNLIVSGNTKSSTYSIVSDGIDYINSDLLTGTLQETLNQSNKIAEHGNHKYDGINICVDCDNNNLNMSGLILHQTIAKNCLSASTKSCKLLYSNNKILPMYFNNNFSEKVTAYDCEGDVDSAIAIIEDNFKFSTGMMIPYF